MTHGAAHDALVAHDLLARTVAAETERDQLRRDYAALIEAFAELEDQEEAAKAERDSYRKALEDAAQFAEGMHVAAVDDIYSDPFDDGRWNAADLIAKRLRAAITPAQEKADG